MEQTLNRPAPKFLQWILNFKWYEWVGWLVELGMFATFIVVVQTQFLERETRAGWISILLTILFCGPGIWLLLGYRPAKGSKFGKFDIGAIICFGIWVIMMFYLVFPDANFNVPSPFGSPV